MIRYIGVKQYQILYPLSEFSAILTIPDNIKEDWKKAIKEFYDFIITSQDENIIKYKEKNSDLLNTIKL